MTIASPPERFRQPEVLRGILLALGSAVAFGLSTPWVSRASTGLGPFTTASLLYAGAAVAAFVLGRFARVPGAPLRATDAGRMIGIAAAGAFVAPVCLVWGIQRTGPATGALLLNLEAVFTTILAAATLREPIGRRVAWALVAMVGGGVLLALDREGTAAWPILGSIAVLLAALSWAIDNMLSRPLAEREPLAVVGAKGSIGAAGSAVVAMASGEALPSTAQALALLTCGATGYGLSLRLYLLAQRRVGAGRTASVFAIAPFLGAAVSWMLGDSAFGPLALVGAVGFGVGVLLHATERHDHAHVHMATEHEHVHTHDDGHHPHAHAPPVTGPHSHRHAHATFLHSHEHAPDIHHDHHGRSKPSRGVAEC